MANYQHAGPMKGECYGYRGVQTEEKDVAAKPDEVLKSKSKKAKPKRKVVKHEV